MNQFGIERLFYDLGGKYIHSEGSSQLIRMDLGKSFDPIQIIKVRDSTTKQYYILRVPLTINTCKDAIAWTFGMTADEFNPIKET